MKGRAINSKSSENTMLFLVNYMVDYIYWFTHQGDYKNQGCYALIAQPFAYQSKLNIINHVNYSHNGSFLLKKCIIYYVSRTNFLSLMITPSRQTNSLQTYSKKYISILNNSWYSALEATRWLQNLSALIKSACTIVEAVDVEGRSTLIHCSDGWDRTPQLASLAQLLLDPYYRTIKVRKRVNLLSCFYLLFLLLFLCVLFHWLVVWVSTG